ncbi:MAG: tetratricopeptide repeat protein [Myxococcaceae bacterium]|nr:tetratricopeptide repeat protein [Myxococcaceae bacterium]
MSEGRTAREVAKLLGLSEAEVRRCARAGFLTATPGPDGEPRFTFQDLVLLKQHAQLISARIKPHRVRAAFTRLKAQVPNGAPLSGVEVTAEGRAIVARDGEKVWDPLSGQIHFDFQMPDDSARRNAAPAKLEVAARAPRGESVEALYQKACALEEVDPDAAIRAYRAVLEANPAHVDAAVNLGGLLHEAGRPAEAVEVWRRALEQGPNALLSFNLGVALEDLGQEDEAIRAYQAAIAADPNAEDAYFNLSRIYERRGERAAALRALIAYRNLTRR